MTADKTWRDMMKQAKSDRWVLAVFGINNLSTGITIILGCYMGQPALAGTLS